MIDLVQTLRLPAVTFAPFVFPKPDLTALEAGIDAALLRRRATRPARQEAARKGWATRKGQGA